MAHSSESGPGHFQQPSRGSSPQSYDLSSPESPQEGSTGSSWYHSQNTVPLLDARTPPTEQAYRNSWFPQNDSSYPSFASPQESQSGHSNYFNHGSKKGPSDSDPSLRPSVSNRYVIPTPTLLYMGPEKDDTLHSAGEPLVGAGKARLLADSTYIRGHKNFFNSRACSNLISIFCVLVGIIFLFIFLPVYNIILPTFYKDPKSFKQASPSWNENDFFKRPLVDVATPSSALKKKDVNGEELKLVWSDEFETDGRSFWPGDDPYLEAVDLHYFMTGDLEWYDRDRVYTKDGNLVIEVVAADPDNNHNLQFQSGMVSSWNKLCLSGGLIEAKFRLPGHAGSKTSKTFWSAFWMLGNLGRPGYAATTEGMWPYSYDSCDIGTLSNQSRSDEREDVDLAFSYLPGQKLSACTCEGEDHPGPKVNGNYRGRAAPELDVFELSSYEATQSFQLAPFNRGRQFTQDPGKTYEIDEDTEVNSWFGNAYQQTCSAITPVARDAFAEVGDDSVVMGVSYRPGRDDGYISWQQNNKQSWRVNANAFPGDEKAGISQRLIPEEPMAFVLNVAISRDFGGLDFDTLIGDLPAKMLVDWVRIYQPASSQESVTCDTDSHPTADYINKHLETYLNRNVTSWEATDAPWPKNRLVDDC